MKNNNLFTLCHLIAFVVLSNVSGNAQKNDKGINLIQADNIKKHIEYIASDSLKGRDTPSNGLTLTANYIINEFQTYGLRPVNNSYKQHIPLFTLSLGKNNHVSITKDGSVKDLIIKSGFIPFDIPADTTVNADIIFVGYGITAEEYKYDDYKNIDVKGKIVLMFTHEPGENNDLSVFDGKNITRYSDIKYKAENAKKHGAIGVLVISDPVNHMIMRPRGYSWPSLLNNKEDNIVKLKKDETVNKIPVVHVGEQAANLFFGSVEALQQIQNKIDSMCKPNSFAISNAKAMMQVQVFEKDADCNNIVGFIPGSDAKLKDEIVIVGAHYDHVGYKKNHKQGEDYIYNGADDNASGTTALLEVAEAIGKSKVELKRSVLFIAFTGEEKGLFGSVFYTRSPLFSLDKTVAMINMDMIGRNSYDTLYIEAADVSPDLAKVADECNQNVGFRLVREGNEFLGSSDQAPFYKKNIPILFLSAGLHPDYHTVRDNPDLINFNKIERVAKLVFRVLLEVGNSEKHYGINTGSDEEN